MAILNANLEPKRAPDPPCVAIPAVRAVVEARVQVEVAKPVRSISKVSLPGRIKDCKSPRANPLSRNGKALIGAARGLVDIRRTVMQSQENGQLSLTSRSIRTNIVLTVGLKQPPVSLLQDTFQALSFARRCSLGNRTRILVGRNIKIITLI